MGFYGLVQAGRYWTIKVTTDLTSKGLEQSHADPCVFRRIVDEGVVAVIIIYVDNLLIRTKGSKHHGRVPGRPAI